MQHSGAVVSMAASQQEGPEFWSFCVCIFSVSTWEVLQLPTVQRHGVTHSKISHRCECE